MRCASPGAPTLAIGVLVLDYEADRLYAKFRANWWKAVDQGTMWCDLDTDIARHASDMGAMRCLEWLRATLSPPFQIDTLRPLATKSLLTAVDDLFRDYVCPSEHDELSRSRIVGHKRKSEPRINRYFHLRPAFCIGCVSASVLAALVLVAMQRHRNVRVPNPSHVERDRPSEPLPWFSLTRSFWTLELPDDIHVSPSLELKSKRKQKKFVAVMRRAAVPLHAAPLLDLPPQLVSYSEAPASVIPTGIAEAPVYRSSNRKGVKRVLGAIGRAFK